MKELVSIIIPSYNRHDFLSETLESVVLQTYKNWECIVVDDGSLDYTQELIEFYLKKDERIKFFCRPETKQKGASSCRNFGLSKAKGELIQFLDSDDLLGRTKLEEQVKFYKPGGLSLFICKWGWFKNSNDLYKRFKKDYHSFRNFKDSENLLSIFGLHDEYLPIHNYLIPMRLIIKAGEWNEDLSNNDDGEFMTRIILNSSNIIYTETAEVFYRYDNNDKLSEISTKEKIDSFISSWKLIANHVLEGSKQKRNPYVARAKNNLYKKLKDIAPDQIEKEKDFLKGRINFDRKYIRNFYIVLEKLGLKKYELTSFKK
ncbi:glycosyl transferase family 2 [Salegentibacter sp. 24]|uniref:glycosyltransferase family 2 protein n=1 Tax=Salegentibacter sp. 24 TaxID=2183986 RepID=UPI001061EAAA|nr:glycosyltransferase family 2 protein [Salegentibacter sp. 24]TDN89150.1 glycosyl transferase family 2 [Salegentibacter sp. 24]